MRYLWHSRIESAKPTSRSPEPSMPTYEYACKACEHRFEIVQSFSEDALTTCPDCDRDELRKVYNAAGIIFKGDGWHIKDYASKKPSTSTASSSSDDAGSSSTKKDGGAKKDGGTKKDSGSSAVKPAAN